MQGDYGDLQLGRLLLRETFKAGETSSDSRGMDLEGEESMPPLTRAQVVARHDNLLALEQGGILPVTWTDKAERNGYYRLTSTSADCTEYRNEVITSQWKVGLDRLGSDSEIDLQSRLTGVVRANDFGLSGERWHAPPIGHYGYFTGATTPSVMTRTGADGPITVYRGVPANVSPRWGCPPSSYLNGRVRLTSSGAELCGVDQALPSTGWALSNGLVNVTASASTSLDVQAYTDGAWRSKLWNVSVAGSASSITSWDGATLLRNDPEQVVLRLTKGLSPGRATLDLTLRRGSRTVEGYLQTSTSSTLSAYLAVAETYTSFAASGYVTATSDDSAGNRFAVGSARAFTTHASGGILKSSTTSLDFWIGAVATQPTLNSNPAFETDTSGWATTNATLDRSNTQAKNGAWSGLLTATAGAAPRARTSPNSLASVGQSYRASGWLYAPAAIPTGVAINIQWYDASQAFISTSSNSATPAPGVWFFMDADFTAPPSAAYAAATFGMNGTPGAGVLLHGDDVRLSASTPPGDGAADLRNQYIAAMPETTYAVRR